MAKMQELGAQAEAAATHALSVTVTADPARLDAMLAARDFDALAALPCGRYFARPV